MSEPEQGNERRSDPRVTSEYRVHLVVSLHGFDDEDRRYEARGVTVNLSHRGALVRVDRLLDEGTRCLVHLPDGGKSLGRTLIYATVLRTREADDTFETAIEFETRLHAISIEELSIDD